ncbi:MAG: septum formation initiator family protein [bacterium]|nr:septum formation initiator family protein [bacterium]
MAEKQRRQEPRANNSISSVQVMFAMILGIGLLLAINFSSRITESQPLQDEYRRILAEIDALEREQEALSALRDYVRSDLYVERWARDNGKMVRPNEVLVVPVPSGSIIPATPVPVLVADVQTAPPTPEPWELWWGLFFDGESPDF